MRRRLLIALGLAVAAATPSPATMLRPMPLERVTGEAARIVHGTVVDVRSGRDASGLPATWITLDVARTLKGRGGRHLTIKQYGVTAPLADGTFTRVAGLPRYARGEEVVLFLRGESRLGFTSTVGFGQGKYGVQRRGRRARVRRRAPAGESRDLEHFLSEVERLAGGIR